MQGFSLTRPVRPLYPSFCSYFHDFMHFYFLYSMRWESFQKSGYFSKKLFFQNFNWSNLIFDQSKSCLKNSVSLCLVRLIEPVFRSIEHRVSSFLKTVFWLIQTLFQNFFQTSLSLSLWLGKAPLKIFCRLQPNFCKVFLSQGR